MGLWSKVFGKKTEPEQPAEAKSEPAKNPPAAAPAKPTTAPKVEAPKPQLAPPPKPDPEVNIVQLNQELHNMPMADLMKAAYMGMVHAYGDQLVKAMENPNLEERIKGVESVEALMSVVVKFLGEYDKATVILRKMIAQAKREIDRAKVATPGTPAPVQAAAAAPTGPAAAPVGGPRKLTPKNPGS